MTFVEAAIELLKREGGPLSVEILAERAASEGLLKRPSKNPLSAMKGGLTRELKRGEEARVIAVDEGLFALPEAEAAEAEPAVEADVEAESESDGETAERPARRRRRRRRRRGGGNGVPERELDAAPEEVDDGEGDEAEDQDDEAEDEDEDDPGSQRRAIEPQTPEELELAELYAGESEVASAADRSEYSDELSADEDRPMLPAIKAERRGRRGRDGRRDRGRGRDRDRDRRPRNRDRDRDRDTEGDEGRRAESAVAASDLIGQVVEVMTDSSERSMQWSQLAATLRKRAGRSESTEDLASMLRRAVLLEETSAARLQIAPRVLCRGRDRVSLGSRDGSDLHAALSRREDEVRVALTHRLSGLSDKKLEVIAEVYLVRSGYRDINWVKRVSPSSYAAVVDPGGETVLVGARAGGTPVDRRGVGELRAGVVAKDLRAGLLLAPQPLSDAAREELAKDGPPIVALCGPPFISALIDSGIGVATRSFTVRSLDDSLFERL